ncbi:restriction endonuclease subunit S [Candidatus Woesearchaeota archaeon]|nr:restriction endonuclease subunit S [Candidatus Woesearchaeota archaeon]
MRRKELAKVIPSSWLETEEYRLNAKPYFSGAVEAKMALEKFQCEPLIELVENGKKGIFNGPRFSRVFVNEVSHGMRLISGADMMQADLSYTDMIAKWQARSMPEMVLREGTTLISSYGTVGRCIYARSDMVGHIGSDNVLKVLPDQDKIKPGYLFAFVSSKFGGPIIIMGEGGSVVTYLDPSRVYQLPVPRLGAVEDQAHELIQGSADLRVEAAELLKTAGQMVNDQFGFPEKLALSHRVFSCSTASSTLVLKRLEATFHDAVAQESDRLIAGVPRKDEFSTLGIAISETGRLKQVFVDEEYGAPFLTSGEIFRQCYEPTRFLSNRLLLDESEWATQEGDLLLARSGQVGGIIGRGVWADRRFAGGCVSVDVLRLGAQNSQILPGYLYAYMFLTDVGYRQLIRTAAGSSIPHLSAPDVSRLLIPRCDNALEAEINELVWNAGHKRAEAQEKEDQARTLVERTIEEGGR